MKAWFVAVSGEDLALRGKEGLPSGRDMRRTAPSRALLLLLFSPAAIGLRLPPISFTDRCKAACVAALCSSTPSLAHHPPVRWTFAELQKLSPEERSAILEQSAASAAKPAEAPAATVAATPKFKSSLAAAIAETADAFQPIAARYSPEAVAPLASAVTETGHQKGGSARCGEGYRRESQGFADGTARQDLYRCSRAQRLHLRSGVGPIQLATGQRRRTRDLIALLFLWPQRNLKARESSSQGICPMRRVRRT